MEDADIARCLGADPAPVLARRLLWVSVPAFPLYTLLVLAGGVRMLVWADLLVPLALAGTAWAAWTTVERRAPAVRSHALAVEALRSGRLGSAWQVRRTPAGGYVIVDPANWLLFLVDRIVDLDAVRRVGLDGSVVEIALGAENGAENGPACRVDLGDRGEAAAFRQSLADLAGVS